MSLGIPRLIVLSRVGQFPDSCHSVVSAFGSAFYFLSSLYLFTQESFTSTTYEYQDPSEETRDSPISSGYTEAFHHWVTEQLKTVEITRSLERTQVTNIKGSYSEHLALSSKSTTAEMSTSPLRRCGDQIRCLFQSA